MPQSLISYAEAIKYTKNPTTTCNSISALVAVVKAKEGYRKQALQRP